MCPVFVPIGEAEHIAGVDEVGNGIGKSIVKDSATVCACGCGEILVVVGRQYAQGHKKKLFAEPRLCLCGCGEYTALTSKGYTSRYVYGHQARGSHNSRSGVAMPEETKARISATKKARNLPSHWLGRKHNDATKLKMSEVKKGVFSGERNPFYAKRHTEATMCRIAETKALMASTPSSPEVAVSKVLDTLNVRYETQKPVGRYLADFYLPDLNAVLFVDGCYWHACPDHFPDKTRSPRDLARYDYFAEKGINYASIWEHDIELNVLERVSRAVDEVDSRNWGG